MASGGEGKPLGAVYKMLCKYVPENLLRSICYADKESHISVLIWMTKPLFQK
jgi:hypothetical protein